mgnify:CR=1 FL=1
MNSLCILSLLLYITNSLSIEELDKDKMYLLIGEEIFMVNLLENEITKELISVLPLKSKLIKEKYDYMHIPLSVRIESDMEISMENSLLNINKGDLFLFKGNELILFDDVSNLNDINKDYIKIGNVVEAEGIVKYAEKNNSIFLWNTLNYVNQKEKVRPYGFYNSIMNYFTWKVFTFFCFLLL